MCGQITCLIQLPEHKSKIDQKIKVINSIVSKDQVWIHGSSQVPWVVPSLLDPLPIGTDAGGKTKSD